MMELLNLKASIVALTQPRVPGISTAEELLAYVARVSNPSNQDNNATAPKLIKYLLKNHHWSPLEMVHVVVEVETTRDIARQILRHRSFSFQEFSQRYADPTKELGFVTREARLQDKKNRQNSIEILTEDDERIKQWQLLQYGVIGQAQEAYEWAIANGIAKEQARAVLPEGLTTSRLYMAGNLRSWHHYCSLRKGNGTQKEHSGIAQAIWEELRKDFPATTQAIEEIEWEQRMGTMQVPAETQSQPSTPHMKKWWKFWK